MVETEHVEPGVWDDLGVWICGGAGCGVGVCRGVHRAE